MDTKELRNEIVQELQEGEKYKKIVKDIDKFILRRDKFIMSLEDGFLTTGAVATYIIKTIEEKYFPKEVKK